MKFYPSILFGPMSPGAMVRTIRELQELSQNDLAALSGLAQSTISAIESDRVALGVARAAKLAVALRVHPAVLLFPDWNAQHRQSRVA